MGCNGQSGKRPLTPARPPRVGLRSAVGCTCKPREAVLYPDSVSGRRRPEGRTLLK